MHILYTLDKLWAHAEEIPFNSAWHNGTGYFDGIVKYFDAESTWGSSWRPSGKSNLQVMVRFTDDQGRKAVAIPTEREVVVVQERYRPKKDGNADNESAVVVNVYRRGLNANLQ